MKWFGKTWGAPVCEAETHVVTPVGEPCNRCEEPIVEGDDGVMISSSDGLVPLHLNCHLRSIIGSVAHIEGRCGCFNPGSDEGDDPDLTRRQAADAAVAAWEAVR